VIVVARGVRRLTGLTGRRSWPPGVALEIPRCRSVHTFGMRFALDLVWLDSDRRVVRVDRAVPPWRVRSCRAARSVLELRTSASGGGFESVEAVQTSARVNVTCVTPVGEEVASTS
jgi:uncharacterized protein